MKVKTILGNRLLIRPLPVESSIALPANVERPRTFWAEVVLRGTGKDIPPQLLPGARVFCERTGGEPLKDGTEIVNYLDVLAYPA